MGQGRLNLWLGLFTVAVTILLVVIAIQLQRTVQMLVEVRELGNATHELGRTQVDGMRDLRRWQLLDLIYKGSCECDTVDSPDCWPHTQISKAVKEYVRIERDRGVKPDLSYSKLCGALLMRANLKEAILYEADLSYAYLSGSDLRGAILDRSKLKGADLRKTDLSETSLDLADLSGADLSDAKNLTQDQIDSTQGDLETDLGRDSSLVRADEWFRPTEPEDKEDE